MQDHIHFQTSKLMGAKDSPTYKAQPMLVRSGCGTLYFCPSYIKMKLEDEHDIEKKSNPV